MSKASIVVASVTQQPIKAESSTIPDRVLRVRPKAMSSDGTTAWQADDRRWSIDDVDVYKPCMSIYHTI